MSSNHLPEMTVVKTQDICNVGVDCVLQTVTDGVEIKLQRIANGRPLRTVFEVVFCENFWVSSRRNLFFVVVYDSGFVCASHVPHAIGNRCNKYICNRLLLFRSQ